MSLFGHSNCLRFSMGPLCEFARDVLIAMTLARRVEGLKQSAEMNSVEIVDELEQSDHQKHLVLSGCSHSSIAFSSSSSVLRTCVSGIFR
jgi:hypothetical protein